MLKNIQILVKISQLKLDEKRRELASIQSRRDNLLRIVDEIEEEIRLEMSNINKNQDARDFLQNFINGARERQDDLRTEAEKLIPEIDRIRLQVSEQFTEVKKFETVLENKVQEAKLEEQKKTQLELDEIAMQKHSSKNISASG